MGYSVNLFRLLDTRENEEKSQQILESNDEQQIASLTRSDVIGVLLASLAPLFAAFASGSGILVALIPVVVSTILLLTSLFVSYIVLPEMDLECCEEGRSIGAIIGGFFNFYRGGYKTISGLIGMIVGINWNSYNLDRSDCYFFNNRVEY